MSISLKRLLNETKEVKIYLNKGEKPPKGKKAIKGPKGGMYFMGSPEEKKAKENGKKPADKPKVNIFDKPKTETEPKKVAKPKATVNTFPTEVGYEKQLKNTDPEYIKAAKKYAEDRLVTHKRAPEDFSKIDDKKLERILKNNGERIKRHNMSLHRLDKLPKNNVGKWVNMIDNFESLKRLDDQNQQIKKELESRKNNKNSKKTPEQHQQELDKIGYSSDDDQIEYIKKNLSKPVPDEVIEDLLDIQRIFKFSNQPESYSEMKVARRMSKRYDKYLAKYPQLKELGFDESDTYDPTQEM